MSAGTDPPVRLGTMLFTLVDPHPGHEVAYNRWYERDHFYAGCLVGPWLFAGRRWVATSDLKDRRPAATGGPPVFGDRRAGTYLATYWVQDGHHDDHFDWALDQVKHLHASGRMFAERDHVHTLLYRRDWVVGRDPDGVPIELALDHPFAALLAVMVEGDHAAEAGSRFTDREVPALIADTPVAVAAGFRPIPLADDAPVSQPDVGDLSRLSLQLWFSDEAPGADLAPSLASIAMAVERSGLGRVKWASAFRPTIPGSDAYTSMLA